MILKKGGGKSSSDACMAINCVNNIVVLVLLDLSDLILLYRLIYYLFITWHIVFSNRALCLLGLLPGKSSLKSMIYILFESFLLWGLKRNGFLCACF